jgi:hypothetical protein
MERKRNAGTAFPDYASLHPGYGPCETSIRLLFACKNGISLPTQF